MPRLTKAGPKLFAAVLTILAARDAHSATQYDMTVLAPSPFNGGEAYGVDRGRVVGAGFNGAVLWPTPTTWVNLAPSGYDTSMALALFGNQTVGTAHSSTDHQPHAVIWNGNTANVVVLSAAPSQALATDGAQQVGVTSGPGAGLWSGTAASFVPLNPAGYSSSAATGVWRGVQVGYGKPVGGNTQALAWHGTASSFTVLRNGSEALGISRGQAVGFTDLGPQRDACIWNNTAASGFEDLAPSGATASELMSTNGTQQVGDVSVFVGVGGTLPDDHHPSIWRGTASSYQQLPLPQGDNYGFAFSIDGDGNIAGIAGTETGAVTGNIVPIRWVPHRLTGDANFDGKVDFSDLLILAQNYGQPGEWVDGEFSGGGTVDFADLLTLAQHYGQSQPAIEYSMVSVPEPSSFALLASGAILVGARSVICAGGVECVV